MGAGKEMGAGRRVVSAGVDACERQYMYLFQVISAFVLLFLFQNNLNTALPPPQIEHLGAMFPSLEALVLAECPIASLPEDGLYAESFPCLKYLSLNSCQVSDWESLYSINSFPRLSELRLHHCPLYEVCGVCGAVCTA